MVNIWQRISCRKGSSDGKMVIEYDNSGWDAVSPCSFIGKLR